MVDWSSLHSITVSMHEGMLTLAFIAVAVRFALSILPRIPVAGWFFSQEFVEKASRYSEVTAFTAALGGTIGIIASSVTGTVLYTPREILKSPLVMNKVMVTIFSFLFWVDFLAIRLKYGDECIWSNRVLKFFYSVLALLGFALTTISGSIGGTLAGKETILEPLYHFFDIHKTEPWLLPPIVDFSKMLVNSPLQNLLNLAFTLQIVIVMNILITALVLIYIAASAHSKTT